MTAVPESLAELTRRFRAAAEATEFPPLSIDCPAYGERDPMQPVYMAGNLNARAALLGRDLGAREALLGEPLVGPSGQLVRRVLHEVVLGPVDQAALDRDPLLHAVLEHVLLANLVPYKPPGNKAYPARVRERFRPLVAELLAAHFTGEAVITLGNDAFAWFAPYAKGGKTELAEFFAREDRYEAPFQVEISAETPAGPVRRAITLLPLPHPSPANAVWRGRFPELLRHRLAQAGIAAG